MRVGVAKEGFPGERRVSLVPSAVAQLVKHGMQILVESGAGSEAGFTDDQYRNSGAEVVGGRAELLEQVEVATKIRTAGADPEGFASELELMRPGQVVIGLCDPLVGLDSVRAAADRGVDLFSLEMMPRITRAQSMDVLSSMATIAGYKAVLLAANHLPKLLPMLMTAAGTVAAARALVIGAGVAGLQAIATARRLGATVEAYDVRPAVKEQVESIGARFVEMELDTTGAEDAGGYARQLGKEFYQRQQELMARVVAAADFVVTTAAIPGRQAPVLITAEMVETMQTGSVIVDLAAERGGNCELSEAGKITSHFGVTILAPLNLPATVPYHASQMYARNLTTFLKHITPEGALTYDLEDEITAGTLLTHGGRVVHPHILELLQGD